MTTPAEVPIARRAKNAEAGLVVFNGATLMKCKDRSPSRRIVARGRLMSAASRIAIGGAACLCLTDAVIAARVPPIAVSRGQQQRAAPDDSSVTITTREGTRTETRVFNNPASRVARVVRTTAPDGTRTTRVYYRGGEVRQLSATAEDSALEATDDALANLAGSSLDVTQEAAPRDANEPRSVTSDENNANGANAAAEAVRPRTVTIPNTATTAPTGKPDGSSSSIVEQAGDKLGDGASAAKRGAGKVLDKGAEAAGAGARRTKDAARDVAGDAAGVAGRGAKGAARVAAKGTVRGAAEAGEATGDAARATGGGIGRGLRRIGRGFKRIFGS